MLSILIFLEAVITVSRLCRFCWMIIAGIRSTKDLKRLPYFMTIVHIVLFDIIGFSACRERITSRYLGIYRLNRIAGSIGRCKRIFFLLDDPASVVCISRLVIGRCSWGIDCNSPHQRTGDCFSVSLILIATAVIVHLDVKSLFK